MTTWIRVRDKETGHEYDVAEQAVNVDAHEPLDRPPYEATDPRPAKHRTDKAAKADPKPKPTGAEANPPKAGDAGDVTEEAHRG